MTAITTPYNVGTGPMMFLSPDYLPVLGNCGRNPTAWSYGGGGNYPRPFTSYTQRIVEASNSLGPFARRVGGGASGRVILSIFDPSSGQLAFREQPWYGFNDGNTGYVSKAEWWDKSIKVYVQLRDVHVEGHPWDVFEVAFNSPGELNMYVGQWEFVNILGGTLAPYLGMLTGIPSLFYPLLSKLPPWYTEGSAGASPNYGILDMKPIDFYLTQIPKAVFENFIQNESALKSALEDLLDIASLPVDWLTDYLGGWIQGYYMGAAGVATHIEHNTTPPDANGDFTNNPGETKDNPIDINWTDEQMLEMIKLLGDGTQLVDYSGNNNTEIASMHLGNYMNNELHQWLDRFGMGKAGLLNPYAIGTFMVLGKSISNESTTWGAPIDKVAKNPDINSNGVLNYGDTYHFGHQDHGDHDHGWLQWLQDSNPTLKDGIDSFFDTAPANWKAWQLAYAGAIREANEGGTPDENAPLQGLTQLQPSFLNFPMDPHLLKQGNPQFYQALKDKGYYAAFGIDVNTLP